MGLGEPLNIIVSSESTPEVLKDSKEDGGIQNWWLALNFGESCLGLAATGGQKANLGDGRGVSEYTTLTSGRRETLADPWLVADPRLHLLCRSFP